MAMIGDFVAGSELFSLCNSGDTAEFTAVRYRGVVASRRTPRHTRRGQRNGNGSPPQLEWVELTARRHDLDVPTDVAPPKFAVIAGISCLIAAVFIGLSVVGSMSGDRIASGENFGNDTDQTIGSALSVIPTTQGQQDTIPTTPESTAVPKVVVPTATQDWLDGYLVVWAQGRGALRVAVASTGEELTTERWSTLPWPLSPEATIFSASNSTWVLDPNNVAASGQLSNGVQLTRLGADLDSYSFTTTTDTVHDFFVGSLWGPAGEGLAQAPASSEIFSVQNRGVVVGHVNGSSSILDKDGFRNLPSRLGRVVAAASDHVVGLHCDDLGRCVGRVQDWEGESEQQLPAATTGLPNVHLSPDGSVLSTNDSTGWTLTTLADGVSVQRETRTGPTTEAQWSSDGTMLSWELDGEFRVARPAIDGFDVRSIDWTLSGDDERNTENSTVVLVRIQE